MNTNVTVNVRISLAVRPGWLVFTNGTFVTGMMTLNEYAEGLRPYAEWDVMHVSDHDKGLAAEIRAYADSSSPPPAKEG